MMQVGERSVLTVEPEYAFGKGGYPPMIPEQTKLQFDVRILMGLKCQIELLSIEP